jgi:hypothetical protein
MPATNRGSRLYLLGMLEMKGDLIDLPETNSQLARRTFGFVAQYSSTMATTPTDPQTHFVLHHAAAWMQYIQ